MPAEPLYLTVIENPFEPLKVDRSRPEYRHGAVVSEYVPSRFDNVIVSLNGEIIEQNELLITKVNPGDSIVCTPEPLGGGDNKSILRMVAMIVISVFAPQAGAAMATFGGSQAVWTAGVMIAGSMLVNTLLPINPVMPENKNPYEDSPTYGIDGPKNTSTEGVVTPVVYGRYRTAGNVLSAYVENVSPTEQYLRMLINAGEGEIELITDINLNDQPLENFKDYQIETRPGNGDQMPIAWFGSSLTPKSVGITLGTEYTNYTTTGAVDQFRVDVIAPNGLVEFTDEGDRLRVQRYLTIEYRKQGDVDWINMSNDKEVTSYVEKYFYYDLNGGYEDELRPGTTKNAYEWVNLREAGVTTGTLRQDGVIGYEDGPNGGPIEVHRQVGMSKIVAIKGNQILVSGKQTSTLRFSYTSPSLDNAVYEIRVKRQTAESTDPKIIDKLIWTDLNETTTGQVAYRHTALLGISVRMSEQLNSMPNVTFENFGRKIKVRRVVNNEEVWQTEWSSNPAWIVYDMMTNRRIGARIAESRIDIEAWQEWADYCVINGLTYNGVFDTEANIWDSMQYVFRAGHAQIVNIGTRYSVAIERQDSPVMMFNVGNIIEKTFSLNWLPMNDRANELEVTYNDADNDYKSSIITVRDPNLISGKKIRTGRLRLYGITDKDRAIEEAVFQLNLNRHILTTVSFEAPIEAIGCTVGSLVYVQHELANWDISGRCEAGSTTTITQLDREVTLNANTTYSLLVMLDSVIRSSGVVEGVVGNIVWLGGYDGNESVTRLIVNGVDRKVVRVVNDGGAGYGVALENVDGILVSDAYQLFDTDVIEEREVITGAGVVTQVAVSTAFSDSPAQFTKWMIGPVETVKRPYRVVAIDGDQGYTRQLTCVEYNDQVYDLTNSVVLPNYTNAEQIGHVQTLVVDTSYTTIGGVSRPVNTVSWNYPASGIYAGAHIYASINSGDYVKIGEVTGNQTSFDHEAAVGTDVTYLVVARDPYNRTSIMSTAPTVNVIVPARTTTAAPTTLTVVGSGDKAELSWTQPTEMFDHIEIARSLTDDVATATIIDTTTSNTYLDTPPTKAVYFYWVRSVTADAIPSGWNAVNGEAIPTPAAASDLAMIGAFTSDALTVGWSEVANAYDYVVEVYANALLSRAIATRDTTFTYTRTDAENDGNVDRAVTIRVFPRNLNGAQGSVTAITETNAQISVATSVTATNSYDSYAVNFPKIDSVDLAGYRIHASQVSGFTPSESNLVYDGKTNGALISANVGETWYVKVAGYDIWGIESLTYSTEVNVTISEIGMTIADLTDQITRTHLAQTLEDELNAVEGEYAIKVSARNSDGQPYIAGFGISVEQGTGNSGALESNAIFKVDNFAIIPSDVNSSTLPKAPFIVSGGVVYMSTTMIEDASITNAKIGDIIQSTNYSPSSGWKINKIGSAEFSEIIIRDGSGNVILTSGGQYNAAISNNVTENAVTTVRRPVGASYSMTNSAVTGAIVVKLPQSWTNTMLRFYVDVFSYETSKAFAVTCGGYNNVANARWYNNFAQIIGNTGSNNRVRFGHDGSVCCVVIGDTASVWRYPKITVRDFQAGHSNYTESQWNDGWAVTIVNDLTGYTFTGSDFSDALLDAKSIVGQGAMATKDSADYSADVSGTKPPTNADHTQTAIQTGITVTSGLIKRGTNEIMLDWTNRRVTIGGETYRSKGIQFEYNGGNPRAYIGDGDKQYMEFDGANLAIGEKTKILGVPSIANTYGHYIESYFESIDGWHILENFGGAVAYPTDKSFLQLSTPETTTVWAGAKMSLNRRLNPTANSWNYKKMFVANLTKAAILGLPVKGYIVHGGSGFTSSYSNTIGFELDYSKSFGQAWIRGALKAANGTTKYTSYVGSAEISVDLMLAVEYDPATKTATYYVNETNIGSLIETVDMTTIEVSSIMHFGISADVNSSAIANLRMHNVKYWQNGYT